MRGRVSVMQAEMLEDEREPNSISKLVPLTSF
jgi:hypothetical protein